MELKMQSPRKARARRNLVVALAVSGLVAGLSASPAFANTNYNVEGTLNCGGALAQYPTFRLHASGPSSLRKTFDNWITGTQTRYGLRKKDGTQVTQTIVFNVGQYTTKSSRRRAGPPRSRRGATR